MTDRHHIQSVDAFRVRIPLATPYHLSKVYGTLTHSDSVLLRLTLTDGTRGWGEADPGGPKFTGDTSESVMRDVQAIAPGLIGQSVVDWVGLKRGLNSKGSLNAAIDVACHDALGLATGKPVWELLGDRQRQCVDMLWPTSSGDARSDLAVIEDYAKRGFRTFMLKMGDRPVEEDLRRVHEVIEGLPEGVAVMADANQGWTLDEAMQFVEGSEYLPLVLLEQPVSAGDLSGMRQLAERAAYPVSVDESLKSPEDARAVISARAAGVFSVKISKNGGLACAYRIAEDAARTGKKVLMNSMIELGITQAASLHLGCVLTNLVDCGHAYMSTLRMSDDITDFSDWTGGGRVCLPDAPGLGVTVFDDKINRYKVDECHVS